MMFLRLGSCIVGLALSALPAAEPAWAIADAPMRAAFRSDRAADSPETGWLLELPELGVTSANLADVVLTDAKGTQLPLAKVTRMEANRVLLLAQALPKEQEVFVYFGGNRQRRELKWAPKVSLLLETRRLPGGTKLDDFNAVETAWKNSRESDGAGFVSTIAQGENPFGESANFLSHYTGLLRLPDKKAQLYTISSDASFVLANDKLVVSWPGKHSAQTNEKTVPRGEVASEVPIKIDYYHAKEGTGATMVLGWVKEGKLQPIPAEAWLHPGTTRLTRLEQVAGWPVPRPELKLESYIGFNNQWLYEVRASLTGGVPAGWQAHWIWSDGALREGPKADRILVGPAPVRVTVRLTNGTQQTSGAEQIEFSGQTREASINNPTDVRRYLALIEAEEPARLNPAALAGHLALVNEFGTDQLIGRYGTAWIGKNNNQADPLWLSAQIARLRGMAQSAPAAAIAELHKFDLATRKKFPQLAVLEMDILVFGMKSAEAVPLAQRISFENPNSDEARLAKVRVGDLYRLLGRVKEARAIYDSVQKSIPDATGGNKLPAMDRAYSVTINGLIDQGERKAAEAKLGEWEADHPLAKYESDFLLLHGRVLMMFGRWNEALQEMESFRTIQGDNPFQILADFYRAQALFELGKKDEARKIWSDLARNYPKHELAGEAARLSK